MYMDPLITKFSFVHVSAQCSACSNSVRMQIDSCERAVQNCTYKCAHISFERKFSWLMHNWVS